MKARLAQLGPVHRALEDVLSRCDRVARMETDPIEYVHRAARAGSTQDVEIVALLAASFAFGNVKALRAKIEDALARIGGDVAGACENSPKLHARFDGFVHRVYRGDDVAALLVGARSVQKAHGSLGAFFGATLRRSDGDMRESLAQFVDAIRAAGPLAARSSRGARHILPDPRAGSGSKRLLLFLRWMVRGPDGVDLGLWREHVPASALLVPVDVHIHKLAKNLGLSARAAVGWATTVEITASLARLDPTDPVRFDFSLCHMGMSQRCPSKRDPRACDGCAVQPVCKWWMRAK